MPRLRQLDVVDVRRSLSCFDFCSRVRRAQIAAGSGPHNRSAPVLFWLLFDANFGDRRYAARSWVAGLMTLLVAIFAGASKGGASLPATRSSFALDFALVVVIGTSSFLLFAFDF
jgi:hypothetical protein